MKLAVIVQNTETPPGRPRCGFDGCGRLHHANGFCSGHDRQRRLGILLAPLRTRVSHLSVAERLDAKTDKSGDCHLWTGAIVVRDGYGRVVVNGGVVLAHRAAWELVNGPVPDGMQVDHICHVHRCVNPDHLRLVTHKQNMENRRGAQVGNRTGIRGVSLTSGGRFAAVVGHNGRKYRAGTFDTAQEAGEAAAALRAELFTHSVECQPAAS